MIDQANEADIRFEMSADVRPVADALKELAGYSDAFGRQLTGALRDAAIGGKTLEDVLRRVGLSLAGMALSRGLEPLSGELADILGKGLSKLGNVIPFAKGGVVNAPTTFPMGGTGGTTGLMGEAGAEAILPLRRASDGRLGVAVSGGNAAPVSVVFNVATPDAASFRKSEAQITGMLARAVSRGARTL